MWWRMGVELVCSESWVVVEVEVDWVEVCRA